MIKEFLKQEVKASTGCTEPGAVALSTAKAKSYLSGEIKKIDVEVSKSIYKNGIYVKIPGAEGARGNKIAAALGVVIKCDTPDLQILYNTNSEYKIKAEKLISKKLINIYPNDKTGVYIKTTMKDSNNDVCECIIEDNHSNFSKISLNEKIIFENNDKFKNCNFFEANKLENMTLSEIIKISTNIDEEDIEFIISGALMNIKAAEYTLKDCHESIENIGKKLNSIFLEDKINEKIRKYSSAASFTRMNGALVNIMSSCGSGNQGIVNTIPVYLFGKFVKASDKEIAEAISLSHFLSGYIKFYVGKLAPICGAFYSAGSGATAGIAYLKKLNEQKILQAVDTMISNTTGVLCDGAKESCAFRIGIAVEEAYYSVIMAEKNLFVENNQGFLGNCCSESIKNISKINEFGMKEIDNSIISILEGRENKY
jgi:L-cysteine desulfidase